MHRVAPRLPKKSTALPVKDIESEGGDQERIRGRANILERGRHARGFLQLS